MLKTHFLKTESRYWDAIACGLKPFEARRNDRHFAVGDYLMLVRGTSDEDVINAQEYWEKTRLVFNGCLRVRVTYVLHGPQFGIQDGHVVMAVRLASPTVDP